VNEPPLCLVNNRSLWFCIWPLTNNRHILNATALYSRDYRPSQAPKWQVQVLFLRVQVLWFWNPKVQVRVMRFQVQVQVQVPKKRDSNPNRVQLLNSSTIYRSTLLCRYFFTFLCLFHAVLTNKVEYISALSEWKVMHAFGARSVHLTTIRRFKYIAYPAIQIKPNQNHPLLRLIAVIGLKYMNRNRRAYISS
jgi:hypothetical protein